MAHLLLNTHGVEATDPHSTDPATAKEFDLQSGERTGQHGESHGRQTHPHHRAQRKAGSTTTSWATIWRLGHRGVRTHWLRMLLSMLAIALGCAFITGTAVITSSIEASMQQMVRTQYSGIDVLVRGKTDWMREQEEAGNADAINQAGSELAGLQALLTAENPVHIDDLYRLREDPEVARVVVLSEFSVAVESATGQQMFSGEAPVLAAFNSVPAGTEGEPLHITEGVEPTKPGEAVVGQSAGLALGETLRITKNEQTHTIEIVGLYDDSPQASSASQQGGSLSATDKDDQIKFYVSEDYLLSDFTDGIYIGTLALVGANMHGAELVDYLSNRHPLAQYLDASTLSEQLTSSIQTATVFLHALLLAFAVIALVICCFIVANTFNVVATQRTEEFSLLRTLGAQARQVYAIVLMEAVLLGVVGAALGVGLGLGFAGMIVATMNAFDLPVQAAISVRASAVVSALLVGVLVAVASALRPARRAASVRPLEVVRSLESRSTPSLSRRTTAAKLCALAAAVLATLAWLGNGAAPLAAVLMGLAVSALLVAVFLGGPALLVGFSELFAPATPTGRHAKMDRTTNQTLRLLAVRNARRMPRRNATTAFALMLGVGLVSALHVAAATVDKNLAEHLRQEVTAAATVQSSSDNSFALPAEITSMLDSTAEVGAVLFGSYAPVTVEPNASVPLTTVFTADPSQHISFTNIEGSLDLTQEHTFIADHETASKHSWSLGEQVMLYGPTGEQLREVTLIGTYDSNEAVGHAAIGANVLVGLPYSPNRNLATYFVNPAPGITEDQLIEALKRTLSIFPLLRIQPGSEYSNVEAFLVRQTVLLMYALLVLSLVVAVLGIVNTLVLAVMERRGELSRLRAIGLTRANVRSIIRREALTIAIFGSGLGMALGVGVACLGLKVLGTLESGAGLDFISANPVVLAAIFFGGVAAGWCAAIVPAAITSRIHPLHG